MAGGLKRVVYTTLIVGAVATGGYLADKTFHLGIKENIAERLIDNPKDASGIYLNTLRRSVNSQYQDRISDVIIQSGQYLDDKTKILTADELILMSSPKLQESYLETKLNHMPDQRRNAFVRSALQKMSPDTLNAIIASQPESVQSGIVKYVVGSQIKEFYEGAKQSVLKMYESTIGRLVKKN